MICQRVFHNLSTFTQYFNELVSYHSIGTLFLKRDFVFVRDVVAANMRAAFDAPDSAGGAPYNVGTGDAVSVLDLWRAIAATVNMPAEPEFAPQRPGEVRDSVADITAAHTTFGFTPETNLQTGLTETIAWYRDNGTFV
jgi:nucleoside-diphosphate-sugar epimerase